MKSFLLYLRVGSLRSKILRLTRILDIRADNKRATPMLFALYQTSLYYYDVVNELHYDAEEAIAVQPWPVKLSN